MVNLSSRRKFRINSAKSFAHTPQLRASPRPSRPREGRAHLGWAAVPAGPPWARCAGSGGAPALPSLSPPGDSLAAPCSVPSRPESSKLRLSKYICVYIYTQIDTRTHARSCCIRAIDICGRCRSIHLSFPPALHNCRFPLPSTARRRWRRRGEAPQPPRPADARPHLAHSQRFLIRVYKEEKQKACGLESCGGTAKGGGGREKHPTAHSEVTGRVA